MQISAKTIGTLSILLTSGETRLTDLKDISEANHAFWVEDAPNQLAVATPVLASLARELPTHEEALASIVACDTRVREEWLRIVGARLHEIGSLRDIEGLCTAITILSNASQEVFDLTSRFSLRPTKYSKIEEELFGFSAEKAQALPKLLRVLGASAQYFRRDSLSTISTPPIIDQLNPQNNWIKSRLILPPVTTDERNESMRMPLYVLSGELFTLQSKQGSDSETENQMMSWVLKTPWAFLLAQIVFVQEAWEAERVAGSVFLELGRENVDLFKRPPEVRVIVKQPNGEEIDCGSLRELVLRTLDYLGVTILCRTTDDLDMRLSYVIEKLLDHKVWTFAFTERDAKAGYRIDPSFSDTCYRAIGTKHFVRLGSNVSTAVRLSCQSWATERLVACGSREIDLARA